MCSDDNDTKCSKLLRASLRGTSGYIAILIDTVLLIHIYIAPQSVDNVQTVFQVTAVYMLLATHIGPINDIKGPAAGLIRYRPGLCVYSQWHTVVSSYTPGKCLWGESFLQWCIV